MCNDHLLIKTIFYRFLVIESAYVCVQGSHGDLDIIVFTMLMML